MLNQRLNVNCEHACRVRRRGDIGGSNAAPVTHHVVRQSSFAHHFPAHGYCTASDAR